MTYAFWGTRLLYATHGACLGGAVGAVGTGVTEGTAAEPLAIAVLLALLAFGAWRGWRTRVVETPRGVVLHGMLRTVEVAWDDVEDVEDGGSWELSSLSCPALRVAGRDRPILLRPMAYWMWPFERPTRSARRFQAVAEEWRRHVSG